VVSAAAAVVGHYKPGHRHILRLNLHRTLLHFHFNKIERLATK